MQKQFVTYEIASKLKELGFDEECFGYYTPMKNWMISTNPKYNSNPHFIGPNWCTEDMKMRFMYVQNSFGDRDSTVKNSKFTKNIQNVAVPLWQQVIDWFRNKYKLLIDSPKLDEWNIGKWSVIITSLDKSIVLEEYVGQPYWRIYRCFNSYEEAREQAILKALELINKD